MLIRTSHSNFIPRLQNQESFFDRNTTRMDSTTETNHFQHQNNHHHSRGGVDQPRRRLHKAASLKFPRSSDAAAAVAKNDIPRYTSLRDLADANGNTCLGRDSSDIGIKNRLVKHAASAYIQSSAGLLGADRSRNSYASFRDKINRNKAVLCSCWRAYIRDPIMACFRPILRFFSLLAC